MKALSRHWLEAQGLFLGPSIKLTLLWEFFLLLSNDGLKQIEKKQSQLPVATNITEVRSSLIQAVFRNIFLKDIIY